jgi:hypothetical protein
MKNIKSYKLFEAKEKKDWKTLVYNLQKQFKDSIDKSLNLNGLNINDIVEHLLLDINDVIEPYHYKYNEYIYLHKTDDDSYGIPLSENGIIKNNIYSSKTNYGQYTKIINYMNSYPKFEYIITFYSLPGISYKYEKSDILNIFDNLIHYLTNLGFKLAISKNSYTMGMSIFIDKLVELDTVDVSDLVPSNKVDNFKNFIIQKNLSRKDAEHIVNIFLNKKFSAKDAEDVIKILQ